MQTFKVQTPNGVIEVQGPEGTSDEDILSFVQQHLDSQAPEAPKEDDKPGEFTKGVKRSLMQGVSSALVEFPAVVGELLNKYENAGYDTSALQSLNKEVQSYAQDTNPSSVPSIKDIHSVSDTGKFVAGGAGGAVGSLLTSLAGAGLGKALVGSVVKGLSEEASKKALEHVMIAGATMNNLAQETGSTYQTLAEGGKNEPVTALLAGVAKAGIEGLSEASLFNKILGPIGADKAAKSLLKRVGVNAVEQSAAEGATEGLQEAVDIAAEHIAGLQPDVFTADNAVRLLDSSLKGAIGGALFGGATGVRGTDTSGIKDKVVDLTKKTNETLKGATQALDTVKTTEAPKKRKAALEIEETVLPSVDENTTSPELDLLNKSFTPIEKVKANAMSASMQVRNKEPQQVSLKKAVNKVVADREAIQAPTNPAYFDEKFNALLKDLTVDQTSLTGLSKEEAETVVKQSKDPTQPVDVSISSPTTQARTEDAYVRTPEQVKQLEELFPVTMGVKAKKANKKVSKKEVKANTEVSVPEEAKPFVEALHNNGKGLSKEAALNVWKSGRGSAAGQEVMTSDEASKLYEDTTKLQQKKSPMGTVQDEHVVPTVLADRLKGIPLSETMTKALAPIITHASDIINRTVGEGKANVQFFHKLLQDDNHNTILGAQFRNVIALALTPETSLQNVSETAHHEVFHMLMEHGGFTKETRQWILDNAHKLVKFIDKDDVLGDTDIERLLSTPLGREELVANAYGKWAAKQPTHPEYQGIFQKVKNFLQHLAQQLRSKLGKETYNDLFNAVRDGRHSLTAANHIVKVSRLERLALQQKQQDINASEKQTDKYRLDRAISGTNEVTRREGKTLGFFGKNIATLAALANKHPLAAFLFSLIQRRNDSIKEIANRLSKKIGDFHAIPEEEKHQICAFMNKMRKKGIKTFINDKGLLSWSEEDTKTGAQRHFSLKDTDYNRAFSSQYIQVRDTLHEVSEILKELTLEHFTRNLVGGNKITLKNIDDLYRLLPQEQHNRIEDLKAQLQDLSILKDTDYFPHMRFGEHGYVVKMSDTGKILHFATLEKGEGKLLFDPKQRKETEDDIWTRFGGKKGVSIYGLDGKRITSREGMEPFKLTKDAIRSTLNTSFANVELFTSLLQSKVQDESVFNDMKDALDNEIVKGFKRRFLPDENVSGYSEDYPRALTSYLTGASTFLANYRHGPEMGELLGALQSQKLSDPILNQRLLSDLKYNTEPSNDAHLIRSANFLWAMGGSVSSAVLQAITLPTFTLASMNRYNPDMVGNMKRLGKYMKVGTELFAAGAIKFHNGSLRLDLTSPKVAHILIKNGTPHSLQFLSKLEKFNYLTGTNFDNSLEFSDKKANTLREKGVQGIEKFSHYAGVPMAIAEQLTRFTTALAAYDVFIKNPEAIQNFKRTLKEDPVFAEQFKERTEFTDQENAALLIMHEAHSYAGKVGRAPYQRGVSGAIFFPFMSYSHQMWETLFKWGKQTGGLKAVATTAAMFLLLGGMNAVPGIEPLKDLLELIMKNGFDYDDSIDRIIRQKMYETLGTDVPGKMLMTGATRAAGVDISQRSALPVPGWQFIDFMGGKSKDPNSVFGVQGSMLSAIVNAWNDYNTDASKGHILGSLLPVAMSNLVKAGVYSQEGVRSKNGSQLLTDKEIKASTVLFKALGLTSDQLSSAYEQREWESNIDKRYKPAMLDFSKRIQNNMADLQRARNNNDYAEAEEKQAELNNTIQEMVQFTREHPTGVSVGAFVKSNIQKGIQTQYGLDTNKGKNKKLTVERNKVREMFKND